jgi:hypothetical protein
VVSKYVMKNGSAFFSSCQNLPDCRQNCLLFLGLDFFKPGKTEIRVRALKNESQ